MAVPERILLPKLKVDEALEEIKRQSGRQFDPRVVDAFLKIVDH
jgi:response regulator RpfG family c-di-GMP phosphodiesterase